MKKKLLLLVAIATFGLTSFAQVPEVSSAPFSLEGGISLNGLTGQTFVAPVLRVRYFLNDNIAARIGILYSNNNNIDKVYGLNDGGFQVETKLGTYETQAQQIGMSIGAAYHLPKIEKLSTFFAFDAQISSAKNNETWTYYDPTIDAYDENIKGFAQNSASGVGFSLSAGCDYYFAENIYIGLEVGFNLLSQKDKGSQASQTVGNVTTSADFFPNNDSFTFANSSSNFIRIGWRF